MYKFITSMSRFKLSTRGKIEVVGALSPLATGMDLTLVARKIFQYRLLTFFVII